jgi:hypothetical protein
MEILVENPLSMKVLNGKITYNHPKLMDFPLQHLITGGYSNKIGITPMISW